MTVPDPPEMVMVGDSTSSSTWNVRVITLSTFAFVESALFDSICELTIVGSTWSITNRFILWLPSVSFPGRSDIMAFKIKVSSSANPVIASTCSIVKEFNLSVPTSEFVIVIESPNFSKALFPTLAQI